MKVGFGTMRIVVVLVALIGYVTCVTVNTKYGDVIGQTWALHNGKSVNSFLAIPFGKAPVGPLRFAKPEEPEPWETPLVANTLGPACTQDGGILLLTQILWDRFSEDCLHMNVYTPEDMSKGPYAVMVWFHGGAYQSSANIQYPGYFLAARDVIVVVPNYRLGSLGFASTGDSAAPGNWGLWDQNQALKFVQENIANFGGDPEQVTIFGQSAGASSSGLHIVSPESRGLFKRAIYQSGSDVTLWAVNIPESSPEDYTKQAATQLGCPTEDSSAMIECLREREASDVKGVNVDCSEGWFCLGFAPVVDGEGGFLPKTPYEIRGANEHAQIDIMAGQCNKDGSFYTVAFIPEALDGGFNRSQFYGIIRERMIDYFGPQVPDEKTREDVFQAFTFQFTPWPHMNDTEENDQNRQAFNDLITDGGFGYAQDRVNKQHMTDKNVFYYIMSYRSSAITEIIPEWLGVPHNGELPYLWGWTQIQLNPELREETEMYIDLFDWNQKDVDYADYIMDLWTNFAKYGDPTHVPVDKPDGTGATVWEPYQDLENLPYLDIDNTVEQKINYRQDYFAFWQTYLPYVSGLDIFTSMSRLFSGLQESSGTNTEGIMETVVEEILHKKLGKQ